MSAELALPVCPRSFLPVCPRSFIAGVVTGHTVGLGDKSPCLFPALLVTEHPDVCPAALTSLSELGTRFCSLSCLLHASVRACGYSSLYHQHLAQCPLHTRISIKVFRILNMFTGWPKHSFGFFHHTSWKNLERVGQPNAMTYKPRDPGQVRQFLSPEREYTVECEVQLSELSEQGSK